MSIQNIQIVQGLFRTVEERLNSKKENVSTQGDESMPQINTYDLHDKAADNPNVLSSKEDLMKVVYPPFFPIGNTQDILSIEGVKTPAGENEKSASADTVEEQKEIQQKDIDSKVANLDAGAVRHDNVQASNTHIKNKLPQVIHGSNPGVVLDLKV